MSIEKANKVNAAMRKLAAGKELTLEEKILTNTANSEELTLYAQQFNAMAREANLSSGNPRRIARQQEIDEARKSRELQKERAMAQIVFEQRVSTDVTWLASNVDLHTRERVNRAALAEVDRRREILDYFAANPEARKNAIESIRRENLGLITPAQIEAILEEKTSLAKINMPTENGRFVIKANSEGRVTVWPSIQGLGSGE